MSEKFEELALIVQATHEIRASRGGYVLASALFNIAEEAFTLLEPFHPVILGGFAVSLHGDPMATKDFDLTVAPDSYQKARDTLLANGFSKKDHLNFKFVNIEKFEKGGIDVDLLSFTNNKLDQAIHQDTVQTSLFEKSVEIVSAEILLVLKLLSNRPKDQIAVNSIIANNPGLDKLKVRDLLQELKIFDRLPQGL
jgi:hypothetical protein